MAAAAPSTAGPAVLPSSTLAIVSQTVTQTGAAIRFPVSGELAISPLRAYLTAFPQYPAVGQKVTIVLSVSNPGAAPLVNLQAGLEASYGTVYVSAIAGPLPPAPTGLAPAAAAAFTWTLSVSGTVKVGLSASVTGSIAGQAAPLVATASLSLSVPPVAVLETRLSPNPLHVSAGQWVGVVLTVSNTGEVTATDVVPAISVSSGGPLVTFQKGPVPAKPVTLKPGRSERFTFTYSCNGSGVVTFSGTVSGKADLSGPGIMSRSAVTLRAKSKVWVEKTAETSAVLKARAKKILFPPRPPAPTEKLFIGFEVPGQELWVDDGYALTSLVPEHATEGKYALRAEFMVPSDLTFTVTGDWKPSISLATPARGTRLPLDPRDWSKYTAFRADCYNDCAQPVSLTLVLTDRRGWRLSVPFQLPAASSTTLEVPVSAPQAARIEIDRLSELKLAVDTSSLAKRPVLFLDNLRFGLPVIAEIALTTTIAGSSTTPVQPVLTQTGTGKPARKP